MEEAFLRRGQDPGSVQQAKPAGSPQQTPEESNAERDTKSSHEDTSSVFLESFSTLFFSFCQCCALGVFGIEIP